MSSMTKKQLTVSLKKLMSKLSLDKITVKDVALDCGVNRQTFYYHFQDIYELLGYIFKTEALGAIRDYKTYETWQLGFLKIFKYVEDNKAFCLSTFCSLGRDHLEQFLNDVTFDLLYSVVEELSNSNNISRAGIISKEDKIFIANFYTYAFVSLLLAWLKTGAKENPENIIEKLAKLIDGDISRAIEKYIQV
jgi:probable dihydroxyacetone kinase regulator